MTAATAQVGAAAFAQAWQEGHTLALEAALVLGAEVGQELVEGPTRAAGG